MRKIIRKRRLRPTSGRRYQYRIIGQRGSFVGGDEWEDVLITIRIPGLKK